MPLHMHNQETNSKFGVPLSLVPKVSDKARILIVCDDDSIAQRLNIALQGAGLSSERARTMTAGCALARSGRFHVVVTIPILKDGSWRRLADIASQFDLGLWSFLWPATLTSTNVPKRWRPGHSTF